MLITPTKLAHFRKLHKVGLFTSRSLVLVMLECGEDSSRLFRDLAEACDIKKGTLSQILDTMAKDQLIQRTVPAKNQRDTRVYLTRTGRDSVQQMLDFLAHFPT
jgi:DNA-binding MarR family transcriptional regulator